MALSQQQQSCSAPAPTRAEETCCFYLLAMLCGYHLSACLHCFPGEPEKNVIGHLTGHTVVIIAAAVLRPIT